jgi:hypothetical protein
MSKVHPLATGKRAKADAEAHEKLAQVAQESLDGTGAGLAPEPEVKPSSTPKKAK